MMEDDYDYNPFGGPIVEIKVKPREDDPNTIYLLKFTNGTEMHIKENIVDVVPNPNGLIECHKMKYGDWSVEEHNDGGYHYVAGWKATDRIFVNYNNILYIKPLPQRKVIE